MSFQEAWDTVEDRREEIDPNEGIKIHVPNLNILLLTRIHCPTKKIQKTRDPTSSDSREAQR